MSTEKTDKLSDEAIKAARTAGAVDVPEFWKEVEARAELREKPKTATVEPR